MPLASILTAGAWPTSVHWRSAWSSAEVFTKFMQPGRINMLRHSCGARPSATLASPRRSPKACSGASLHAGEARQRSVYSFQGLS